MSPPKLGIKGLRNVKWNVKRVVVVEEVDLDVWMVVMAIVKVVDLEWAVGEEEDTAIGISNVVGATDLDGGPMEKYNCPVDPGGNKRQSKKWKTSLLWVGEIRVRWLIFLLLKVAATKLYSRLLRLRLPYPEKMKLLPRLG